MFDDPSIMPASTKAPFNLAKQQRIMGGIGGGIGLFNQFDSMQQQARQINTNAPGSETDSYGRPSYNLGGFAQSVDAIKPQGAQAGELLNGAAEGAQAGTAIMPGIGTAIGAGVGFIGSAISGGVRKREEERKKQLAQANLRTAQMQYNSSVMAFQNNVAGQSRYNDLMNTDARFQNIIKANNPNA